MLEINICYNELVRSLPCLYESIFTGKLEESVAEPFVFYWIILFFVENYIDHVWSLNNNYCNGCISLFLHSYCYRVSSQHFFSSNTLFSHFVLISNRNVGAQHRTFCSDTSLHKKRYSSPSTSWFALIAQRSHTQKKDVRRFTEFFFISVAPTIFARHNVLWIWFFNSRNLSFTLFLWIHIT